MLVATFAVAYLLQSIALLAFGSLGTIASSLAPLNQPWDIAGVLIRKIAIVSILVAAGCLVLLQLLLDAHVGRPADARRVDGLPHRAAARRAREPRHRRRRARLGRCSPRSSR